VGECLAGPATGPDTAENTRPRPYWEFFKNWYMTNTFTHYARSRPEQQTRRNPGRPNQNVGRNHEWRFTNCGQYHIRRGQDGRMASNSGRAQSFPLPGVQGMSDLAVPFPARRTTSRSISGCAVSTLPEKNASRLYKAVYESDHTGKNEIFTEVGALNRREKIPGPADRQMVAGSVAGGAKRSLT